MQRPMLLYPYRGPPPEDRTPASVATQQLCGTDPIYTTEHSGMSQGQFQHPGPVPVDGMGDLSGAFGGLHLSRNIVSPPNCSVIISDNPSILQWDAIQTSEQAISQERYHNLSGLFTNSQPQGSIVSRGCCILIFEYSSSQWNATQASEHAVSQEVHHQFLGQPRFQDVPLLHHNVDDFASAFRGHHPSGNVVGGVTTYPSQCLKLIIVAVEFFSTPRPARFSNGLSVPQ